MVLLRSDGVAAVLYGDCVPFSILEEMMLGVVVLMLHAALAPTALLEKCLPHALRTRAEAAELRRHMHFR